MRRVAFVQLKACVLALVIVAMDTRDASLAVHIARLLQPVLEQSLQQPFNTLSLLAARLNHAQLSGAQLLRKVQETVQRGDGGNCVALCEALCVACTEALHSAGLAELAAAVVPSRFYGEDEDLWGHCAVTVRTANNSADLPWEGVLLDPGCGVADVIVIDSSRGARYGEGKKSIVFSSEYDLKGESVVVARRRRGKRSFVYYVRETFGEHHKEAIVRSMLQREQFNVLFRDYATGGTRVLVGVDCGSAQFFLLTGEKEALANSSKGRLAAAQRFALEKGSRLSSALADALRLLREAGCSEVLCAALQRLARPEVVASFAERQLPGPLIPRSVHCGAIACASQGPHRVSLASGSQWVCRCGACEEFPLSGEHCALPLEICAEMLGKSSVLICGCGRAKGRQCGRPYCDGSHGAQAPSKPAEKRSRALSARALAAQPLSTTQCGEFMRDGFTILKAVIPQHTVEAALKDVNLMLSELLISERTRDG